MSKKELLKYGHVFYTWIYRNEIYHCILYCNCCVMYFETNYDVINNSLQRKNLLHANV